MMERQTGKDLKNLKVLKAAIVYAAVLDGDEIPNYDEGHPQQRKRSHDREGINDDESSYRRMTPKEMADYVESGQYLEPTSLDATSASQGSVTPVKKPRPIRRKGSKDGARHKMVPAVPAYDQNKHVVLRNCTTGRPAGRNRTARTIPRPKRRYGTWC